MRVFGAKSSIYTALHCLGWGLTAASLFGCNSAPTSKVEPPSEGEQGTVEEEMTSTGIEAWVPVRVVIPSNSCTPVSSTCKPCSDTGNCQVYQMKQGATTFTEAQSLDRLNAMIEVANEVFRPAGVQFYLKAINTYAMPDFMDVKDTQEATGHDWIDIRSQIQKVFPAMPSTAWADHFNLESRKWLEITSAYYSLPSEMVLFLPVVGGGGGTGDFPSEGRASFFGFDILVNYESNVAHEFGHWLGLPHAFKNGTGVTFDAQFSLGNSHIVDPRSDTSITSLSYFWDMIYGNNGTTLSTYTSEYAARSDELYNGYALDVKDRRYTTAGRYWFDAWGNCRIPAGQTDVQCRVGETATTYTASSGSPFADGQGFQGVSGLYTGNVMTYDTGVAASNPHQMISTSQIAHIRRTLRYEVTNRLFASAAYYPAGQGIAVGGRPALKNPPQRPLTPYADIDGDGVRDIVIWDPPTTAGGAGTFKALLSSLAYNPSTPWTCSLGHMGDIPMLFNIANVAGEGAARTDVVVFQPGGGASYDTYSDTNGRWRYRTGGTTCGTEVSFTLGARGDIPLVGNLDTVPGVLEPATYTVASRRFNYRVGGVYSAFYVGTADSTARTVPMLARFNDDEVDDLITYTPSLGQYAVALSASGSWGTPTTFPFTSSSDGYPHSSILPPSGSSASASALYRSESLVIDNLNLYRSTASGTDKRRARFALWQPQDNKAYMNWSDVGGTLTGMLTCPTISTGTEGILVGGINTNADNYSDLLFMIRTASYPVLHRYENTSAGACPYAYATTAVLTTAARDATPFISSDINGDGAPDVWTIDPRTMTWRCWGSPAFNTACSTATTAIQFGSNNSVPL